MLYLKISIAFHIMFNNCERQTYAKYYIYRDNTKQKNVLNGGESKHNVCFLKFIENNKGFKRPNGIRTTGVNDT